MQIDWVGRSKLTKEQKDKRWQEHFFLNMEIENILYDDSTSKVPSSRRESFDEGIGRYDDLIKIIEAA